MALNRVNADSIADGTVIAAFQSAAWPEAN